ncbi:MAG TPA: VCBS repeat-containing protein [Chryseolinea sp.]|nr:VCBS repeat-containing protein [Chryseolinea sp.]
MMGRGWLVLLASSLWVSCAQDTRQFEEVDAAQVGIAFRNDIVETQQTNIMTYEYTYNGAGVAAGDINNDGLVDLYFSGNSAPSKLYTNKGDWKFEDITGFSGTSGKEGWKTGVTMMDVNGDGWLDIYVCYSGNAPGEGYNLPVIRNYQPRANELFINQGCKAGGVPKFIERASAYGLDAVGTFSTQAYFFDVDHDSDLDMLLLNHANMFYAAFFNTNRLRNLRHPYFGNKLFRNDTKFDANGKATTDVHFTDVSDQSGLHGGGLNFSLSASLSDLNHDGWTDIYITNDYEEQDFCYLNNRDGTFREVSHKLFGHLSKFGMGSDIADINNDGMQDVIVLDMLPEDNRRQKLLKGPDEYDRYQLAVDSGYHQQYMRNTLQLNRGFGTDSLPRFSEVAQLSGVSNTDWSWSPFLVDLDNDGLSDLFVTNGYLRDFTNLDFMKYTSGVYQEARQANKPVDYLAIVQQLPQTRLTNYAFRNIDGLTFENVSGQWGLTRQAVSNGAVYADLDNDGDYDIVTNNLNDSPTMLKNRAEQKKSNHFIRIRLQGRKPNTQGTGSRVVVRTDSTTQYREAFTTRGYASSVDPVLTVGLGAAEEATEVEVTWPDGTISVVAHAKAGQTLVIDQTSALPGPPESPSQITLDGSAPRTADLLSDAQGGASPVPSLLRDVTDDSGIHFKHTENAYVDFKSHRLLFYQLSRLGGKFAAADVNADGNDDVFFGGAAGQSGTLYLGHDDGTFYEAPAQPWRDDAAAEDIDALFFDADGDGDSDLFVISGGDEHPPGSALYQDRMYVNSGDGIFSKANAALPRETASGGVVTAADFDKDGDLDLFVGGRHTPGSYGLIPRSTILQNNSQTGNLSFIDVTDRVNANLGSMGMVTAATWTDVNQDSWPDLIIAGEWMPIRVFINEKGKLVAYAGPEFEKTHGWWTNIKADDVDDDGDTDFLLGNAGLNMQFKASADKPVQLFAGDFNQDNVIDPILCYRIMDKNYPLATRDELLDQLAPLRKKFTRYKEYATATIDDILSQEQLEKSYKFEAYTFESSWVENVDGKSFRVHKLPPLAQLSCTQGFAALPPEVEENAILSAGNFYGFKPQLGRSDASMGTVLRYANGSMKLNDGVLSNVYLTGDIRDMALLRFKNGAIRLVVSRNNDRPSVFAFSEVPDDVGNQEKK